MVVSFECYCPTHWGQTLFVTGSVPELGGWNVEEALPLECIAPNKWKVTAQLESKGNVVPEYRYFLKEAHSDHVVWDHHKVRMLSKIGAQFQSLHLKDLWVFPGNKQETWTTSAFAQVIFRRDEDTKIKSKTIGKKESVVSFHIQAPRVSKNQVVAIVGNCKALGNWKVTDGLILTDTGFPFWKGYIDAFDLPKILEYKYLIFDPQKPEQVIWEAGGNRLTFLEDGVSESFYQINEGLFRYPATDLKGAGVSLPVFSIRTDDSFGVGEFTDLNKVVDWANKTGLRMIQVLPVNDTQSMHNFLDSYPYKAISVVALHPIYLNIFKLGKSKDKEMGTLYEKLRQELNQSPSVDYEKIMKLKLSYSKTLFKEKMKTFLQSPDFEQFFKKNANWLVPYAAFSFLRDLNGTSDFSQWDEYKEYKPAKIKKLTDEISEVYPEIAFWYYIQFHLDAQLKEACEYGRKHGVVLKGDIPIGISRFSVDAWFEPKLYHFNGQAGAPPDDFSIDGQNWGFPTYNWEEMAKDHYQWWRNRLTKMAEYFDAYRIDHILGFFRIWEIPIDAVQGILGHFRPALPLSRDEMNHRGIWVDDDRFCKPYIRGHFLPHIFNDYADEVRATYLNELEYNRFELKAEFASQKLIYNHFVGTGGPENLSDKESTLMWGLIRLAAEVLLLPDNEQPHHFHPRISLHSTFSFQELDPYQKARFDEIYIDYFYRRHDHFWKEQAIIKLPALVEATDMLICGEDLGMIPATVPEVMNQFDILSLEIQRMPKDPKKQFAHPADAPYLSVCTTSTHDMATIRGWWEEDRKVTQVFYNQQLGKWGEMPYFAEPWVCQEIIIQHMHSPAMWAIFPIQDLLAMDADLRSQGTHGERINEPANPRHYWKYRLHLSFEELLKAKDFNQLIKNLVTESGRNIE
ncbi:MAG: 4-alpha-glucanotransferase [Salinivirgaceae bacterium]|nr:4-alpha-glucanotransferase [Salinivirgaceae bacterium]